MSQRKERRNRFSVLTDCEAVLDTEIQRRLLDANLAMNDININPRGYPLTRKAEVATDLNWAVRIALPKEEVTGTVIVGKREDQDEDEAGIYLKPNEE